MAVAFDAVGPSSSGSTSTGTSSQTWTHVCGASATLLVVEVGIGTPNPGSASSVSVSVTYGGVAMTVRDPAGGRPTSARGTVQLFELVNPPTGSNSVVVTKTGASSNTTFECGSKSYTGAGSVQNVTKAQDASGNGSSTAAVAVTCSSTNSMVGAGLAAGSNINSTTGTLRWRANYANTSQGGHGQGVDYPGATPTVTVSNGVDTDNWSLVAYEIPVGATNFNGTAAVNATATLSAAGDVDSDADSSAAIRAVFPTGITATTAGSGATHTGPSVTTVAGDMLVWHVVYNSSNDTGVTIGTRTFNGQAADFASTPVHSNGQNAGFEQFFVWKNPGAVTASPSCTASSSAAGWESKAYAVSGTDNTTSPTFETFAPSGTGVTTAASYTTSATVASGALALSGFCAGSSFSATNQTTQVRAQNGTATDAANAIAGSSAAGAGSTVTFTATISSADWYAVTVAIIAPPGTGFSGTASRSATATITATGSLGISAAVNATAAVTAAGVVAKSAGASIAATATLGAGSSNGLGSGPWFTAPSGSPRLIIQAEDWGLLCNAGLNHSGSFTATYDDYVATRSAQGYTSWYGSWCSFGTTGAIDGNRNGADSDGTNPFSTAMNPSTTPNSTFWARRDYLFSALNAAGMRAAVNVTTPYLHRTDANQVPQRTWTQTQWQDFGTFLGNRYKGYTDIVWVVGDDYFDDINTNLNAFKTALRATGDNHPISVQYAQETSSKKDYHAGGGGATTLASFAEFNLGYSYNVSYLVVEGMGNEDSTTPYMYWDGYFMSNGTTSYTPSPLTDRQLMRRNAWWALSSGAKGIYTGDERVWRWDSTALGFLTSESYYTAQIPAIAAYFRTLPKWHLLKADTSSQLVTAGRGTRASLYSGDSYYGDQSGTGGTGTSNNYVTASRTSDGSLAVIYAPGGGTITVDETKLGAGYTATWVDPKTCATTSATPGSTYNFTAKGNNSDGLNEWVLVLQGPATTITGDASLAASSTRTAAGVVGKVGTAALAATVAITATGVVGKNTTATRSETATITATGVVGKTSTASVAATATLTATGVVGKSTTATLVGTATITASGATSSGVEADLAAAATITAVGVVGEFAGATLTGASTITATGVVARTGAASLAAAADVTADGEVTVIGTGTADLDAVATITATGVVARSSTAALTGTAAITVTGVAGAAGTGQAGLNATGTITATGTMAAAGSAALAATGTLSAAGALGKTSGGVVTATATITASGVVGVRGSASLAGTAVVTADGTVVVPGAQSATVTATATITAVGVVATSSEAHLDAVAHLSALGDGGTAVMPTSPRATLVNNGHAAELVGNPYGGKATVDSIVAGDTAPAFTCVLTDAGQPYDATGAASVTVKIWQDNVILVDRAASTVDADGTVTCDWQAGETDEPGPIKARVVVFSGGKQATFPPRGFMTAHISPASP